MLTLLQTLSSLTDDDQKRAVLALQLQLNSIIDNKCDLHGDLYASLAGGIYRYVRFCPCIQNYSVFAYVTLIKMTYLLSNRGDHTHMSSSSAARTTTACESSEISG